MDRRSFLAGAIGVAAATPALAAASVDADGAPSLRGTLGGEGHIELRPRRGAGGELQTLLEKASADDRQVFLPAGTFVVSELRLPPRTRLAGVPGATRLVFGGGAYMVWTERADRVELVGLTIDGAGMPMEAYVPGLVHLAECHAVLIENCTIIGSSASGIALDRSRGRIARTMVREAADAGIRSIEAQGLTITECSVEDCGNAGIQVHRWSEGPDETIVTGNRIGRIRADDGGSGLSGNGISIFRANGVTVAGNRIAECSRTAIRANSSSNVQITGNSCVKSGEAGVLSEFAFEGALIANNLIDGAGNGIGVVNFGDGGRMAVVSNNIVRNIAAKSSGEANAGVGIVIEADATVSGNVIEGAPLAGMRIGWGPNLRDVAATGNVVRKAPVGIGVSVVEGAGPVVIADNLISGADKGAVVGMAYAEVATGDLTQPDAGRYPHLLIERNLVS